MKTGVIMNIYLLITLSAYAVSLHRGIKSWGTLHIMYPTQSGGHVPLSPRESHPCTFVLFNLLLFECTQLKLKTLANYFYILSKRRK